MLCGVSGISNLHELIFYVSIIPKEANTPMKLISTINDTNVIDKILNIFFGFLYQPHIKTVNNVMYKTISGSPIK